MLTRLFGKDFNVYRPAPLERLIDTFQKRNWIAFSDVEDLGELPGGRPIYGEFNVDPLRIRISPRLERWSPRYRFALAHEIGHLALHRDMIGVGRYISREQISSDCEIQLKYREMASLSDLGWVEWQANEFALSLLLPPVFLFEKVSQRQKELGVIKNRGTIFLDKQLINRADAAMTIAFLSHELQIPSSFLTKRLKHLGLIKYSQQSGTASSSGSARDILHSILPFTKDFS